MYHYGKSLMEKGRKQEGRREEAELGKAGAGPTLKRRRGGPEKSLTEVTSQLIEEPEKT